MNDVRMEDIMNLTELIKVDENRENYDGKRIVD